MAGTSTAKAQMILARGFKPSPGGCLGAGVYVCVPRTEPEAVPPRAPRVPTPLLRMSCSGSADDEKAGKFARDRDRHKGDVGARLKARQIKNTRARRIAVG